MTSGGAARTPRSRAFGYGNGIAACACGSMPPGITILPVASITRPASSGSVPGSATATIFSPWTATSHAPTPHGATTRPPRTTRSSIAPRYSMGPYWWAKRTIR
ncbi:MAG: hypothetical protein DMD81_24330 [Candidatus Rokuibacteriota bacterium]|nr:MAG: hypothetical protein DMD81_24330 [Candidatus Rokubacteria bacterium]